jgi:hypothetical protein
MHAHIHQGHIVSPRSRFGIPRGEELGDFADRFHSRSKQRRALARGFNIWFSKIVQPTGYILSESTGGLAPLHVFFVTV